MFKLFKKLFRKRYTGRRDLEAIIKHYGGANRYGISIAKLGEGGIKVWLKSRILGKDVSVAVIHAKEDFGSSMKADRQQLADTIRLLRKLTVRERERIYNKKSFTCGGIEW